MDILSMWPELIRALQGLGAWLFTPMQFFSALGKEEFFLALMPLLYWCVSKPLGTDMGLLLILSSGLSGWLKAAFKLPRPYWVEPALGLDREPSFGLPSGHAMIAATLWGYVALRLWAKRAVIPLLLIVLISLSRLYLGVHYPADLLAGWLFGFGLLALYVWLKPRCLPWLQRRSIPTHAALALCATLATMALYAAVLPAPLVTGTTGFVATASQNAWETGASMSGMLFGLWVGLAVEHHYVQFDTAGTRTQRIIRYLVGMTGVLALWMGLKLIFPAEPLALGLLLRAVRYALMGLWTVVVWPWVFVRLPSTAPSPTASASRV